MALSVDRPAKLRRLRSKTNVQVFSLTEPLGDEDVNAVREVYLVTCPHPKEATSKEGVPLVAPGTLRRQALRDAVLRCCQEPEYDPAWLRWHPGFVAAPVPVRMLVVFREYHAEAISGVVHLHYHVALLLGRGTRFMPLKRALLHKFGLASHWFCSHSGYWSAVRYGIRATPHKPIRALDPAPVAWAAQGPHPPLETAAVEATTARALDARRVHRVQLEGEKGKPSAGLKWMVDPTRDRDGNCLFCHCMDSSLGLATVLLLVAAPLLMYDSMVNGGSSEIVE